MAWIIGGALAIVGIVFTLVLMRVFSVNQAKLTDPARKAPHKNI